jgi:hypothetical protein
MRSLLDRDHAGAAGSIQAAGEEPRLSPSPIYFNRPCENPGASQLLRCGEAAVLFLTADGGNAEV